MRLEGNFYTIHAITTGNPGEYTISAELFADHPIYKGHFPEQPVVPGVCTLTVIRECLAKIMGREVTFTAIKECKYLSALIPQSNIPITINITIADDSQLRATVVNGNSSQSVLKLRATIS